MFAGKKSAQIREILISESAWEEMTCLFAPSLGKGWGINQIATLLKKSNKTISAQKNSAMRRLSLRSNADMYAWINSTQGMRELNLMSAYGEFEEWKKPIQHDISPSSKIAR